MPLAENRVSAMFMEEWHRFTDGIDRIITQRTGQSYAYLRNIPQRDQTAPRTVNVPGWDDIIKIPVGTKIRDTDYQEYKDAKREKRAPNMDPLVVKQIEANRQKNADRRQSAQDDQSQAWGAVMTAIDNVQDFFSTVGTLGRVVIWTAPRIPAALGIEKTAVGLVLAKLGLRAGARLIPFVGWVLLVSDLLNYLNLLGMLASPLYGLLCNGTKGFLAAAAPTVVFKRGLQQEVWKKFSSNPFSKQARADRLLKAASGRVSIPNLLEVAQTTQQLFGWGLSFGAAMGFVAEAVNVVGLKAEGTDVRLVTPTLVTPQAERIAQAIRDYVATGDANHTENVRQAFERTKALTAAQQALIVQSARVLQTAPVIARVQSHFTDDEHLGLMIGVNIAAQIIAWYLHGLPVDDLIAAIVDTEVEVPLLFSQDTHEWIQAEGIDPRAEAHWWFPPYAKRATIGALMDDTIVRVPLAVEDFIEPRRNTAEGVFFGSMVAQLTEQLWTTAAQDNEVLTFQLTTESRVLTSMVQHGRLWLRSNDPSALWRAWTDAKRTLESQRKTYLDTAQLDAIAERHGIEVWKMAPPDQPWPPPPAEWLASVDPSQAPF